MSHRLCFDWTPQTLAKFKQGKQTTLGHTLHNSGQIQTLASFTVFCLSNMCHFCSVQWLFSSERLQTVVLKEKKLKLRS